MAWTIEAALGLLTITASAKNKTVMQVAFYGAAAVGGATTTSVSPSQLPRRRRRHFSSAPPFGAADLLALSSRSSRPCFMI